MPKEIDKSRIYTAVNADELHIGDKVIVGDTSTFLIKVKEYFKEDFIEIIKIKIKGTGSIKNGSMPKLLQ